MAEYDTRPTIALDCDDTLVNLRDPMMAMLNRLSHRQSHWQEWADYHLHRRYRMTPCRLLDLVIEQGVLEQARPEPGAAAAVQALREAGFRIEVWTARRFHPDALKITAETLSPLGIEPDNIRLFRLTESKARRMIQREDVRWLVDDCPRHARWLHRRGHGDRIVVPALPWNRDIAATRMRSLGQIATHIITRSRRERGSYRAVSAESMVA
ncbi:hypothetical protein J7355_13135 [Endozoicomonas sp. G2_2]|uniref:hypothetical protein n=1 Tax=Endozoicomonas sp. G2_2 TaxID=2821092 RepID=UPI001ADD5C5A|nr:hypothetical protein [Endozoicomonas sp. G2_2]MBO9471038.1 hypothetical protein [Endozoicomonas sp. G2_2]